MRDIEYVKELLRKLLVRREDRGATPAEAAQAIELASKLMKKYGLAVGDVADTPTRDESVQLQTKRPKHWVRALVVILADHFRCEAVQREHWRGVVFTFRGPEHLAAVACWLFRAVANELYNSATRSARQAGCRGAKIEQYRCSFLQAAIWSIDNRLDPPTPLTDEEREKLLAEARKHVITHKAPRLSEQQLLAMCNGREFGGNVSLSTNAIGSPRARMALER